MGYGDIGYGEETYGEGVGDVTPPVTHNASISFTATADLDLLAGMTQTAAIAFTATADLDALAKKVVGWSRIRFTARGVFVPTIRPRGKKRRTIVVEDDGTPIGELENATHGALVFEHNTWAQATFALGLIDPKSGLVLEERIREVQMWRGDQVLVFGPMVRPSADKANLAVEVKGPAWHLSRRTVGKANRDDRLTNGNFENGLAGWQFLKGAFFLDFAPLRPGDVAVFEPGKGGGRALALRADIRQWSTPPSIIGAADSTHTVVTGDTLWDLAADFYGSGTQWRRIFDANAAAIEARARQSGLWNPRDPGHWIFPGTVLTIPGVPSGQEVPGYTSEERWGEVYAYQELEVDGGERGVTATLTGWARIRNTEFIDYNTNLRGLSLTRLPTDYRTNNEWSSAENTWGGARGQYTEVIETKQSTVDEDHPFGIWVRHECEIIVPPHETEILHARATSISGLIVWDELRLTFDDALEFYDTDQRDIIAGLVEHAQDPAFGKSDVSLEVDGEPTGVLRDLVALHSEHENIWELVEGFTADDDGVDLSEAFTPTSRTLVVHYPARGSEKPNTALELGRNIADFGWTFDGEAASSAVIVLGTGDGSDREEAAAIDPDAFAGGLTLEEVFAVPEGTPIERLEPLAIERLAVVSSPEVLAVKTYPHGEEIHRNLIGRIWPGDVVPVRIRRGGLNIADAYRIVRLAINPDDTLDLILNLRSSPT